MTFLFAPGAGAPSTSSWMQAWQKRLEALGRVVSFDYDYMRAGRKRPDLLPQLIATHRAQLEQLEAPVVLIGKSMGSRVGCHVSLEAPVHRLVCFGYPLVGQNGKTRDQVLRDLTTPVLFIQGTRDELCPLDHLERVRAEMRAPSTLHVVEGGDHSLTLLKRDLKARNETQDDVDRRIFDAVAAFV